MEKSAQITRSNFGKYGWFLIIFSILLYAFASGINVSGLNLTVTYFADKGWDYNQLLSFSTYGGYIGLVSAIFCGWFMSKAGMRVYFFTTLIIGAAGCVIWGYAASQAMYFVGVTVVSAATNGFATLGTSNLIAIFFPRKKGIAMGWSTMGIHISDVIYLPMLSILIKVVGLPGSYMTIAIIFIVLAVIALIFIRNSPEDKGILPDNMPMTDEELNQLKRNNEKEKTVITFKNVLLCPQTWIVGICFGLQYIICSGVLGQSIVYLVSEGIAMNEAITLFSVTALIGCGGCYAWGFLDGKIGPKKATTVLAIWFTVALLLMTLPFHKFSAYIAVGMFMFATGGAANINASLVVTQFGRYGFAKAFGIINPIVQFLRVSSFLVLSIAMTIFDGVYRKAFLVFLLCAIISVILSFFIKGAPVKVLAESINEEKC